MGYTPNELKTAIDTNTEECIALNTEVKEVKALNEIAPFFIMVQEVETAYLAKEITASQALYKIETIKHS